VPLHRTHVRLGVCRRARPRAYILGVFGMCGFVGRGLLGCCVAVVICWPAGRGGLPGLGWLLTEVYVPPQGASVPESRSLSWSFTLCGVVVVAGSCFPRLPASTRFVAVSRAWGIDHVSVGSVPPRATGVRPGAAWRVGVIISVALGAWCGPAAAVFVFCADVAGSVTGVALGGLGVVGSHFFFWSREGGVIFPAFLV